MLLFGALFSLFASPVAGTLIFRDRFFWHGLVFVTVFNVAVVYSAIHYPDWMWMYFLEQPQNTAFEIFFLLVFLYYLPFVLGFYLGRDLKRLSLWFVYGFIGLMGLSEAWMIATLYERYSVVGTLEEFRNQTAISLFDPQNPLSTVMNAAVGVMVVYLIAVVFLYRREQNRFV